MWSTLIEEGLATVASASDTSAGVERVLDLAEPHAVADSSGGSYAPPGKTTGAGSLSNATPGESAPSSQDQSRADRDRREEQGELTNEERVREMHKDNLFERFLDVLGNIALGPVTEMVNLGSGGGQALGEGVGVIEENQGRGMGGSSRSGREAWDAIDQELGRSEPFPQKGDR